jgi:hypothetical protein
MYRRLHGFAVTATLDLATTDESLGGQVASDICSLLSIASGTKVAWVLQEGRDHAGEIAARKHQELVTRRFSPLPLIDPNGSGDIENFVNATIGVFLQKKDLWQLQQGLIDAYMDAKRTEDYLQSRGIKLVVAVEEFKYVFLQATSLEEFVLPPDVYKKLIPDLRAAIKGVLLRAGVAPHARQAFYPALLGANRKPFQNLLGDLLTLINLQLNANELRLFVRCRNSLVHMGNFYCLTATADDRSDVPPHSGPTEEYFWLLHVVDRMFLKLLDYRGPYVDWTNGVHERQFLP